MEPSAFINKKNNKKSQSWGMDLAIASVIFSFGIILLYVYSMNNPNEAKANIEDLSYNGEGISNIILSEGYPKDWDISNVVRIGILDNNSKINQTKLNRFYNLTVDNYEKTRVLFNTRYDYIFCFFNYTMMINSTTASPTNCAGKPGKSPSNINGAGTENLFKVTRFVIYNNTPVTANVYVWSE
jgi:hypothetical protein